MKVNSEVLIHLLFMVPLSIVMFYIGYTQASSLYQWYSWYENGAESIEAVGKVEEVLLPPRKGAGGHRVIFRKVDGEIILLRAHLSNYEFNDVSFGSGNRVDSSSHTARYTIGITGRNELYHLDFRGRTMFNGPLEKGSRGQVIFAVLFCVVWFSISFGSVWQVFKIFKRRVINV